MRLRFRCSYFRSFRSARQNVKTLQDRLSLFQTRSTASCFRRNGRALTLFAWLAVLMRARLGLRHQGPSHQRGHPAMQRRQTAHEEPWHLQDHQRGVTRDSYCKNSHLTCLIPRTLPNLTPTRSMMRLSYEQLFICGLAFPFVVTIRLFVEQQIF